MLTSLKIQQRNTKEYKRLFCNCAIRSSSVNCNIFPVPPGGGSGIGRAVCQRLAAEGASLVVADRNVGSANQTLESLSRDHKGQEHMVAEVDVSARSSVESLVNSIQVCLGLFINNTTVGHTHTLTHTQAPGSFAIY